jgi:hypothetical protein
MESHPTDSRPVKYRDHRETLVESMKTVREIRSLDEIQSTGKLTCKYYGYDSRIGWETWIVCENGCGIGFSDGELKYLK